MDTITALVYALCVATFGSAVIGASIARRRGQSVLLGFLVGSCFVTCPVAPILYFALTDRKPNVLIAHPAD